MLSAGGLYLALKFGFDAAVSLQQDFHKDITKLLLAALGGVLLLGAALLNGWSPWATLIPGLAITGLGGYGMFVDSGAQKIDQWLRFAFQTGTVSGLATLGVLLLIGLILLGASLGALLARSSGRRLARP